MKREWRKVWELQTAGEEITRALEHEHDDELSTRWRVVRAQNTKKCDFREKGAG